MSNIVQSEAIRDEHVYNSKKKKVRYGFLGAN